MTCIFYCLLMLCAYDVVFKSTLPVHELKKVIVQEHNALTCCFSSVSSNRSKPEMQILFKHRKIKKKTLLLFWDLLQLSEDFAQISDVIWRWWKTKQKHFDKVRAKAFEYIFVLVKIAVPCSMSFLFLKWFLCSTLQWRKTITPLEVITIEKRSKHPRIPTYSNLIRGIRPTGIRWNTRLEYAYFRIMIVFGLSRIYSVKCSSTMVTKKCKNGNRRVSWEEG